MKPPAAILVLWMTAIGVGRSAEVAVMRVPDQGLQPRALVDDQGTLHLVYYSGDPAAGDLFYVNRKPGASSFSPPIKVNGPSSPAVAVGAIRGAQIALGRNGRLHVAWNGSTRGMAAVPPATSPEAPLFYTRLNDAGTAFERPKNLMTHTRGLDGGGSIAADSEGRVYVVWHGREPGAPEGEAGRALYVARSADEGGTFAAEERANAEPTGACGCCGTKAFVDAESRLFLVYRTAGETSRDMVMLDSENHGKTFRSRLVTTWLTQSCPMSSSDIVGKSGELLVATEANGGVVLEALNADGGSGAASRFKVRPGPAKYPSVAINRKGEVLLVWSEGAGWAKGGTLRWQMFDPEGNPTGSQGGGQAVPTWSFGTAVCLDGDSFTVIY